jgi:hypothetical protein
MKRLPLAAFALLAVAPVAAQKATVPYLLKQAFTSPASKQLYAYDFENVNVGNDQKGKTVTSTTRGRIDPSRKKGERVTITFAEDTSDKPVDPKKLDERYERNANGDIFCDSLSETDVTNVSDKGASPAGRVFTFTPKAKSSADGTMKDIMKKMSAEAVIDEATGAIRSFNAVLTKTHNVMLVFDVKSAGMKATCATTPDGRSYAARTEFNMSGSGLGQSILVNSVQTIWNIAPVG